MNMKNVSQRLVVTSLMALCLAACSSSPVVQDLPATASAAAEVTKLSTDLDQAVQAQVNVLSPEQFKKSNESLMSAKHGLDKQKDPKDILKDVAEGRAYLAQANNFAQVARTSIPEVVSARQLAIDATANVIAGDEFRDADKKLMKVTSDIEDNKLKSSKKNRSALQAEYLALELRAIKHSNLNMAKKTIELAKTENAKKFAPRTLAIAEKDLKDADAFIIGNRHDTQVATYSEKARNSADHVLKITRAAKSTDKTSNEDTALLVEKKENQVTETQEQVKARQAMLVRERGSNNALTAENQSLEANQANSQAFEKKFAAAQAQFTPEEAQVYRQGNSLVIRLKGLEFPSSQAVLKGENFPLLAKVQAVIRDFGSNSVTVEGHTDSVGNQAKNQKLSQDRANAVKEYLVSNAADKDLEVKAIGFGYQKPIASNKTPDGRAQNRRVDVLIQTENL